MLINIYLLSPNTPNSQTVKKNKNATVFIILEKRALAIT